MSEQAAQTPTCRSGRQVPEPTRRFKPYPAYNESGVEWLANFPSHWFVKRLRFACRVNPAKSEVARLPSSTEVSFLPMEAIGEYGKLNMEETRPLAQVWQGFTYFRNGDVIVAKITPCFENGKGALCRELIGGIGFGTTELQVLRPGDALWSPFVFYLTQSHPFRNLGIASMKGVAGQQRVTEDFIKDFKACLPPISEQHAIAAFLDRETAKIDALVAKKEQLIELLQEKRAALITQAVTEGLDPTVPMKDPGIQRIGKVPAHWEFTRLKFLTSHVTSGSRGWAEYYSDEGPVFLRIGNLQRNGIDLDLHDVQRVAPPHGVEGERTKVQGGDLVVSITAFIGSVGVVPDDLGDGYVNQHLALARPVLKHAEPRWIAYCLLSRMGQQQFQTSLYGGTKEGLGLDDVKHLVVPMPGLAEQRAITAYIDGEAAKLDALISKVREGIEKLKEYRTALISAAVTGKIDVQDL